MERQVGWTTDAVFPPHLLMAAASARAEQAGDGRATQACASLRSVHATGLGVSAALWINQRICVSVLVCECV